MNDEEKRLAELRKLDVLTDDQMREMIDLSPSGTFKSLPNLISLGVHDVAQAVENLQEGAKRAKHAYEAGCFIEVISLRLQHIDFWLRAYWVVHNQGGHIFDLSDKRPFGTLINDCEKLGFEKCLIERMRAFNASRIDSIHKYLLGAIKYADLKSVCDDHKGLDGEVGAYVQQYACIPI